MKKRTVVCVKCGSDDVRLDAFAMWDKEKQEWVLDSVYDTSWCNSCGSEHDLAFKEIE